MTTLLCRGGTNAQKARQHSPAVWQSSHRLEEIELIQAMSRHRALQQNHVLRDVRLFKDVAFGLVWAGAKVLRSTTTAQ
jgi:hypothetical protein